MKSDYGKKARVVGICLRDCSQRGEGCSDCIRFSNFKEKKDEAWNKTYRKGIKKNEQNS